MKIVDLLDRLIHENFGGEYYITGPDLIGSTDESEWTLGPDLDPIPKDRIYINFDNDEGKVTVYSDKVRRYGFSKDIILSIKDPKLVERLVEKVDLIRTSRNVLV